jgi:hypothetical protein
VIIPAVLPPDLAGVVPRRTVDQRAEEERHSLTLAQASGNEASKIIDRRGHIMSRSARL